MSEFLKENSKYVKWVAVFIASYLGIKIIDNIPELMTIFHVVYSVIAPFIIAFIIAYILNPLVNLFNRRLKLARGVSIILTYALFISLIALALTFLIPNLYSSALDIIDNIPHITKNLEIFANDMLKNINNIVPLDMSVLKTDNIKFITGLSSFVVNITNWILTNAVSVTTSVINVVFGFLISIYVLVDKDNIIKTAKTFILILFKNKNGTRLIKFIKTLNEMVGTYIGIKAIDSTIIAILAFIGLTILKSQYALLLSVIVGMTNMIPYFGPFVGMIVGAFINIFVSPIKALVVFLFLFILQQFDGWYLDPTLIGNKVGLSPILVILAVTVGGAMYGPIGMILGSPILAVLKIYTVKLMNKYKYRAKPEVNNSI
ncbi:AI-2E family transporter [Clostridium tarantellae]|uniref:AI-2E family transporter n=1 Tax=Clostridium tarantellae TaxID=39493 RepID=A0A6I1MN59_9CLOT|nr:AI-2E family transporter [Clostridium tarantellae]MPQ44835.1 AI-2E family transporter [Clostridium tarantellae]